ncbi:pyruvate dehydrogenase (acetyl-transferring) E1 component subunit alpha [Candidatus Foliamicus sp.]
MTVVAKFEIKYTQFLDEHGKTQRELPEFAADAEQMTRMYRFMQLTRIFDRRCINLQRTGQVGTIASSHGHEAAQIGVAAAMRPDDVLAPSYREHGVVIWRGVRMSQLLAVWGGDERGHDWDGARHDFPYCVPIATQCLHAAGAAFALKMRGQENCAVALCGDGATSEGAFYEALNAAGALHLPVVFVVTNNRYAISMPVTGQTAAGTLAQKAIAAGLPGEQVDGNDLIAVRRQADQAMRRARSGGGPSLIEALSYRLGDHTTADDASRYREDSEVQEARDREPLKRMRRLMEANFGWTEEQETALHEEIEAEVEAEVDAYLRMPKPQIEDIFAHQFGNMPAMLEAQREIARKYPVPSHD